MLRRQAPGDILRLQPGESVTLLPGNWHAFWGEGGDVLIGEVSTVNNDLTDNIFAEPIGRFADIEEDEDAAAPAGLGLPALVRVNPGKLRTLLEFVHARGMHNPCTTRMRDPTPRAQVRRSIAAAAIGSGVAKNTRTGGDTGRAAPPTTTPVRLASSLAVPTLTGCRTR